MAEGAPLLRAYVGKTCIEGSNPSDSASDPPSQSGLGLPRRHPSSGILPTRLLSGITTDGLQAAPRLVARPSKRLR